MSSLSLMSENNNIGATNSGLHIFISYVYSKQYHFNDFLFQQLIYFELTLTYESAQIKLLVDPLVLNCKQVKIYLTIWIYVNCNNHQERLKDTQN